MSKLEPNGKLSINIDWTEFTPLEIRGDDSETIVTIHKEYNKLTKEGKIKIISFLLEWCTNELKQNKDDQINTYVTYRK